jgi:predicted transcriptional regulator
MGYYSDLALECYEKGRPLLPGVPLPYQKQSATSREAAESSRSRAGSDRTKIIQFLHSKGNYGATCDELEIALNLTHQTASARIADLKRLGIIQESKATRLTRSKRKASVCMLSSSSDSLLHSNNSTFIRSSQGSSLMNL